MAKEIAIGKRAKISEAQQYMILAVLGAAVVLGIAASLTVHFIQQIFFNAKVIAAEEESIANYSNVIKSIGICKKPSGNAYTRDELTKCNPSSIELSEIGGTLRYNILENVAANDALNSVPKEDDSSCLNSDGEKYTYKELKQQYDDAKTEYDIQEATQRIKKCSALRVIPESLPAFKNEEALLSSLNKIFNVSNWEPESLSPSGTTSTLENGLNTISVNLSVEANSGTTMTVLDNIERSIREFDIERATIEWGSNGTLVLRSQATAYYVDESFIPESTKTIKAEEE